MSELTMEQMDRSSFFAFVRTALARPYKTPDGLLQIAAEARRRECFATESEILKVAATKAFPAARPRVLPDIPPSMFWPDVDDGR